MKKFSIRSTIMYDLPLPAGVPVLKPEQAILRFEHGKTVDIGVLCYLKRESVTAANNAFIRKSTEGRKVVLSSFCPTRASCIRTLIAFISDEVQNSGRRTETLRDRASRFVAFMSWADETGHSNVLYSAAAGRATARAYAAHIRERVTINAISLNSGARQQANVFSMLGDFLEVDDLTRGINLLRKNQANNEATVAPSENDQARVLSLCESMFEGLTKLVLEQNPYPFRLAMPKYLGYPSDALWVFPTVSWFVSLSMQVKRETYLHRSRCYNYHEGRLATLNELREIKNFAKNSDVHRRLAINRAQHQLDIANSDPHHVQRRNVGIQALNVFILMFLAQTGMNWAQVVNMPWSDEYAISATHQAFRTIKWRADNRKVFFELPVAFMPKFKRYLNLRKFLLNGQSCDLLFFKVGIKGMGVPAPIKSGPRPTYIMLKRIDPELPHVMPRQWRAAKSDWLIRNTDPSTTALVLQNSERTVLASYTAGSETAHLEEMTDFLEKFANIVVPKEQPIDCGISRAIGVCSAYGDPHKIPGTEIQPDCKKPEGCLFCDKFKVHADEKDTRKLVSCRYCLQQTAPLAGSEERFQSIFGPIFDRIQIILDEVHRLDKTLVPRITSEVENDGELDPYWASKLEMLLDLGLVV